MARTKWSQRNLVSCSVGCHEEISLFELQKHSSQAHRVHQDHQARRETKVGISCCFTKVLEGSQHLRLKRGKGLGAESPAFVCKKGSVAQLSLSRIPVCYKTSQCLLKKFVSL